MHDELVTECIIFHALVKLRNHQYVTVRALTSPDTSLLNNQGQSIHRELPLFHSIINNIFWIIIIYLSLRFLPLTLTSLGRI